MSMLKYCWNRNRMITDRWQQRTVDSRMYVENEFIECQVKDLVKPNFIQITFFMVTLSLNPKLQIWIGEWNGHIWFKEKVFCFLILQKVEWLKSNMENGFEVWVIIHSVHCAPYTHCTTEYSSTQLIRIGCTLHISIHKTQSPISYAFGVGKLTVFKILI